MSNNSYSMAAGLALKHLIKEKYTSQQEFAEDFGVVLRTVNRYVSDGISDVRRIEEIADFFEMDFLEYLSFGKSLVE